MPGLEREFVQFSNRKEGVKFLMFTTCFVYVLNANLNTNSVLGASSYMKGQVDRPKVFAYIKTYIKQLILQNTSTH